MFRFFPAKGHPFSGSRFPSAGTSWRTSRPCTSCKCRKDENDPRIWHAVPGPHGKALVFDDEALAHAKLEELHPILVKLEHFSAGSKCTRVLNIIID
jgi:hypothetical protein